jgi:hypothetical protein
MLDELFDKYDTNQDDSLNKYELTHMIKELYSNVDEHHIVTKEEIRIFLESADKNDDMLISRQELHDFFKYR